MVVGMYLLYFSYIYFDDGHMHMLPEELTQQRNKFSIDGFKITKTTSFFIKLASIPKREGTFFSLSLQVTPTRLGEKSPPNRRHFQYFLLHFIPSLGEQNTPSPDRVNTLVKLQGGCWRSEQFLFRFFKIIITKFRVDALFLNYKIQ